MNLIIPAAGLSKRFNYVPKWSLDHPSGCLMLTETIRRFDLSNVDRITICTLEKFLTSDLKDRIYSEFQFYGKFLEIITLKDETRSQAHTVSKILEASPDTPIFIKDSDNGYICTPEPINSVCYEKTYLYDLKTPDNKSYIKLAEDNTIQEIKEKKVISDNFCIGGVSFISPSAVLKAYETLAPKESQGEIYLSHIVSHLMEFYTFKGVKCFEYLDWGTLNDWMEFKTSPESYSKYSHVTR